jgi:hypothetical protein
MTTTKTCICLRISLALARPYSMKNIIDHGINSEWDRKSLGDSRTRKSSAKTI